MVKDPVDHRHCDASVTWTSGNVAEAFPGVCTPLGFTFLLLFGLSFLAQRRRGGGRAAGVLS